MPADSPPHYLPARTLPGTPVLEPCLNTTPVAPGSPSLVKGMNRRSQILRLLMQDAARPVPSARAFEIRALSTRRRQLVEMIAAEKVPPLRLAEPPISRTPASMSKA